MYPLQSISPLATVWKFPHDEENYVKYSFMSTLDNTRNYDVKRKERFASLQQLVLMGDAKDGVIIPNEAMWFGTFKWTKIINETIPLKFNETDVYKNDLFGVQSLHKAGKIVMKTTGLDHTQYINKTFFVQEVMPFLADQMSTVVLVCGIILPCVLVVVVIIVFVVIKKKKTVQPKKVVNTYI